MFERKRLGLFFVGFLFLLVVEIQTLSAFGIVSNDYSLDSFHAGLAGGNSSNTNYDSRFTLTYQQGTGSVVSSDYDVNIGWLSLPVEAEEEEEAPEVPTGGGGCTYDWVCSEWYPEPCPSDGIQKRICVNKGTCTGIGGMPNLTRNCTPTIPVGPLFDVFAKIPLTKKWVSPGDTLEVNIQLVNLGDITPLDVFFKYWIVDENNTLIAEMQETRAISEGDKFKIAMALSPNLKLGKYKFYAEINYDVDKVAIAQDSFEIVQSKMGMYIWIGLLVSVSVLVIIDLVLLIFKLIRGGKYRKFKKMF